MAAPGDAEHDGPYSTRSFAVLTVVVLLAITALAGLSTLDLRAHELLSADDYMRYAGATLLVDETLPGAAPTPVAWNPA